MINAFHQNWNYTIKKYYWTFSSCITLISKMQEEIESLTIFWISICFSHSSFTGSLFILSSQTCIAWDSFHPFLHVGIYENDDHIY